MADGVRRFEDLVAWQHARQLAGEVYRATREPAFARDFGLASQIQRSAVSAMANIAEGFERKRPAEFHQFLSIAKASCGEVRSHLYIALDVGYIDEATFERLKSAAEETGRIINGLRNSLRQPQNSELRTQNSEP